MRGLGGFAKDNMIVEADNILVKAIDSYIHKKVDEALTSIGEPQLGDIQLDFPESYGDALKVLHWYKNRIVAVQSQQGDNASETRPRPDPNCTLPGHHHKLIDCKGSK